MATDAKKQPQPDPIDQFRDCLTDMVVVAEKLLPVCESTADLLGVMKLAVSNDGQLKMLSQRVFGE